MSLSTLDLIVIGTYCLLVLTIGIVLSRRASQNVEEYFLSGRSLPWWLAGTSMAATSFSVDTPLYVTALIREHGIYRNWEWWSWALGGGVAAFVFAPLWRRAKVLTDVEFTMLRYQGRAAKGLRIFRALYLAIPINCIAMAGVYLALKKVLFATVGWEGNGPIYLFGTIAVIYSLCSGFWGVVVTDLLQFFIALIAAVMIAAFALSAAGGFSGLQEGIASGAQGSSTLSFFPPGSSEGGLSPAWGGFFVFLFVSWWANQNADGGGKIIQRMSACKDERHAWMATLWFNIAHYVVRTWPWILAALATLVVFPDMTDPEMAYPRIIGELLPSGIRGFALVSLIAAFMSTIDTQLNWGASYLVNDLYRPTAAHLKLSPRYEVPVSWISVILVTGIALLIASEITSVKRNFHFLISFGAGAGSVYILRWFWWRVTPWSEISAMVVSALTSTALRLGFLVDFSTVHSDLRFPVTVLLVVGTSTVAWVGVTWILRAPDPRGLVGFYERVRPDGWWGPVRELVAPLEADASDGRVSWGLCDSVILAFSAGGLVLMLTIAPGFFFVGRPVAGAMALSLGGVLGGILAYRLRRKSR